MRLLVGAGTPNEAAAKGWDLFLAQPSADGSFNTNIIPLGIVPASDQVTIAYFIKVDP